MELLERTNTVESNNNNKPQTEAQMQRSKQEQSDTKTAVATFQVLKENAATGSATATEAMLLQAQVVLQFSDTQGRFATALSDFRRETCLESASKWSQFRKIGKVVDALLPHKAKLPSGWTSLYTVASVLGEKDKNGKKIRIEDLFVVMDKTGSRPELNAYSTQREVRLIANKVKDPGRVESKKKTEPAGPTLNVGIQLDASKLPLGGTDDLEESLRSNLLKKFPFVVDIVVTKNKVLKTTVEGKEKNARATQKVAA